MFVAISETAPTGGTVMNRTSIPSYIIIIKRTLEYLTTLHFFTCVGMLSTGHFQTQYFNQSIVSHGGREQPAPLQYCAQMSPTHAETVPRTCQWSMERQRMDDNATESIRWHPAASGTSVVTGLSGSPLVRSTSVYIAAASLHAESRDS